MPGPNRRWTARGGKSELPEDWNDLIVLRDIVSKMMSPLVHENPPIILERCDDCHVPLHGGKELHYYRRFFYSRGGPRYQLTRGFRKHRCTALAPIPMPMPFLDANWRLP